MVSDAQLQSLDKTEKSAPTYRALCQLTCHELVDITIPDLRVSEGNFVNCRFCNVQHPLFYNSITGELKIYRKSVKNTGKNIIFWKQINYRMVIDWEVF